MEIVKLYPDCKDNIWGGVKLRDKYGKQTDKDPVAESWELSFHKDGPTRLADGKTLQEVATEADLGGTAGHSHSSQCLLSLLMLSKICLCRYTLPTAMLWRMKTALVRRKCGTLSKRMRARGFTLVLSAR